MYHQNTLNNSKLLFGLCSVHMLHHILTITGIQNTKNENVTNHKVKNKNKKSLSVVQPITWRLKIFK